MRDGVPLWVPIAGSAAAALLGATVALVGGYLARRAEDRRALRAEMVTTALPPVTRLMHDSTDGAHEERFNEAMAVVVRLAATCSGADSARILEVSMAEIDARMAPCGPPDDYGRPSSTPERQAAWGRAEMLLDAYDHDLRILLTGSWRQRVGARRRGRAARRRDLKKHRRWRADVKHGRLP